MSPLVWDLAHIAAYEDLWLVHRYGERPLLREDLAATYDAFETPRAVRGDIELLDSAQARDYLSDVRARALEVIDERGVGDGLLHEMVLRHEHQHNETMLQTLQLARLGDYEPGRAARAAATRRTLVHRTRAGRGPRRAVHDRRAGARVSPTTTSAPATAPMCAGT